MFDALTLATTLVTDSPLLVFDIFVDQMRLFVSDRQHDCIVLKKGSVIYMCTILVIENSKIGVINE